MRLWLQSGWLALRAADAVLHARPDCSQASIRIIATPRYCSMTAAVLAHRYAFMRLI
ncbi:hypothetical protein BCAR13_420057 [Paraburkholderia caribensis]|nr:hypothetical protein BCAR13_420057 [Paraburkholderia caribensis]